MSSPYSLRSGATVSQDANRRMAFVAALSINRCGRLKTSREPESLRALHEVAHGQRMAMGDPEATWGWESPAGRLRAGRRAELILKTARLGPGAHVLEIGCGTGLFTEIFAQSGAVIVAVDISEDLLDRARARGLPQNGSASLSGGLRTASLRVLSTLSLDPRYCITLTSAPPCPGFLTI